MKTLPYFRLKSISFCLIFGFVILLADNVSIFSQDARSVFRNNTVTRFMWGLELKTSGIQEELGTQSGIYACAVFNHSFMAGMVASLNVSHPTVNYGYLGMMFRYIYKPANMIHMSGQFTFGAGSTRDYQNEKTGTFDNFGNVTGTGFYFIEPVINTEINPGPGIKVIFGFGYRLTNGINPNSPYISKTHVSDADLSGFTITAGVEFEL